MMSTETVAMKLGASADEALVIEQICIEFQITSELNKVHFLAEMYVESAGFTTNRENLNYSVEALLSKFGRHRISEADARKYGRTKTQAANPMMIANCIYGGQWGRENLGNTQPGDGFNFSGKGRMQATGRDNYYRYSMARYGDDRAVRNPKMLLDLPDSVAFGAWYWRDKRIWVYAEKDDTLAVARGVNLGNPISAKTPNGLQERVEATMMVKNLFKELKDERKR